MMGIKQSIFGWLNTQTIVNHNIVVDKSYLQHIIQFENNPVDLNLVVLQLNNLLCQDVDLIEKRVIPPSIDEKISFNNVLTYKELIECNYSENGYFLDLAYESLDYDTPGKKKSFLKNINNIYLKILGDFLKKNHTKSKLEVIRDNADSIITEMINILLIRLSENISLIEHVSKENIENSVINIVCHAFVDCKVLENPNNQ